MMNEMKRCVVVDDNTPFVARFSKKRVTDSRCPRDQHVLPFAGRVLRTHPSLLRRSRQCSASGEGGELKAKAKTSNSWK